MYTYHVEILFAGEEKQEKFLQVSSRSTIFVKIIGEYIDQLTTKTMISCTIKFVQ